MYPLVLFYVRDLLPSFLISAFFACIIHVTGPARDEIDTPPDETMTQCESDDMSFTFVLDRPSAIGYEILGTEDGLAGYPLFWMKAVEGIDGSNIIAIETPRNQLGCCHYDIGPQFCDSKPRCRAYFVKVSRLR